ncbi:hypothetical protein HYH03_007812 [Edaphochlamys debaryana]|uniref:Uncharacterized protein n=1 Tax=Edaphochlamys debaryana TaxID=47281 RepID=A0A835Y267_9CHLO|nr:hypothetical protein HYH03_007812 [Edaphochlamys debaryana]|eukprot:KAG2493874.1 hypothetical protein HYH03_007812 [Edaphochlamys debaryana]
MDSLIGKRSGKVLVKDYEDAEFLKKLEPVVQQLEEDCPDAGFDARTLAQLIAQLMQFQEDTLGKESNFKRQPKLPAALLRDFAPKGALYVIAAKCDDIMAARDLQRIDWANPNKRKENMEILIGITKELEAEGLLKQPVCGFEPNLKPDEVARLSEAVKKMGGSVVDGPDDPRVTHRVCVPPYGVGDAGRGKPQQMRTLEVRGDMALVHWTQLPDSYDEWVLARHAPPDRGVPPDKAKWRVYPRWIKDSEVYNEWMNPADYEALEAPPPGAKPAAAAAAPAPAPAAAQPAAPPVPVQVPPELQAPLPGGAVPLPAGQGPAPAAAAPGGDAAAAPPAARPPPVMAPLPGQAPPPAAAGTSGGGAAPGPAGPAAAPAPQPPPPAVQPPQRPQQLQLPHQLQLPSQQLQLPNQPPAQPPQQLQLPGQAAAGAGAAGAQAPAGPSATGALGGSLPSSWLPQPGTTATAPAPSGGPPATAPLPESIRNKRTAVKAAAAAAAAAAAKRNAENQPSKKAKTEVAVGKPDVIDGFAVRVAVNAVKQKVLDANKVAVEPSAFVENVSQGQLPPSNGAPAAVPRAPLPPGTAFVPPPQPPRHLAGPASQPGGVGGAAGKAAPGPVYGTRKEPHIIPSYANWFSLNGLHNFERQYLSDFFDGQSPHRTPETYRSLRAALISMYREDPSRRLTFGEARSRLQGDVTAIHRVWTFLDYWGLINFSAVDAPWPKGGGGGADGPNPFTQVLGPPGTSVTLLAVAAAPGQSALLNLPRPSVADAAAAAASGGGAGAHAVGRAARTQQALNRAAGEPPGSRPRIFCAAMPWVDCSDLRYHCTKFPDIDLCPAAFLEGRFPPGSTARDFVRIDGRARQGLGPTAAAVGAVGVAVGNPHGTPGPEGAWSQQETLLLLEGLEMYGDNWAEVAEHVGTKSQVSCILHFLQLPIEDAFLDDMEAGAGARAGPVPLAAAGAPGTGIRLQQGAAAAAAARQRAAAAAAAAAAGGAASAAAAAAGGFTPLNNIADEELMPFADAANPVLALVAFLTQIVGPRVGAAAAQRALEVLAEEEPAPEPKTKRPAPAPAASTAAAASAPAAPDQPAAGPTAAPDSTAAAPAPADGAAAGPTAMDVDGAAAAAAPAAPAAAPPADGAAAATAAAEPPPQAPTPPPPDPCAAPVSAARMRSAAAAGLAAAVARARLLADEAEAEAVETMAAIVEVAVSKLGLKIKYLEDVEQALDSERTQLENARRKLDEQRRALRDARRARARGGASGGGAAPGAG